MAFKRAKILFLGGLVAAAAVGSFSAVAGLSKADFDKVVKEYEGVRNVALDIMKNYPPTQFYYVGVGSDVALLMAMIQSILDDSNNQYVKNIPLEGMEFMNSSAALDKDLAASARNQYTYWYGRTKVNREKYYTTENVTNLHQYLSSQIPTSAEKIGGRSLLFIGGSYTGMSMVNLQRELVTMMHKRAEGNKIGFSTMALSWNRKGTYSDDGTATFLHQNNVMSVVLEDQFGSFLSEHSAGLAEYEPLDVLALKAGAVPARSSNTRFTEWLDKQHPGLRLERRDFKKYPLNILRQYFDFRPRFNMNGRLYEDVSVPTKYIQRSIEEKYALYATYSDLRFEYAEKAKTDPKVQSFRSLLQKGAVGKENGRAHWLSNCLKFLTN